MTTPRNLDRRTVLKLAAVAGAAAASPLRLFGADAKSATRTVTDYLETLRKSDHGYGWPDQEISHLTPAFHAIGAYHVLKQTPPEKDVLIEFVRTHHPREIKKLEQERRIYDWQ